MKYINRLISLNTFKSSAFLLGPRMTGKTSVIEKSDIDIRYDFLNPNVELKYRGDIRLFGEEINKLPRESKIAVDEVQKIPELLNFVQYGIEKYGHRFILSGSSARKLKRKGVNLLGGRALDLKLHPLCYLELEQSFKPALVMQYGTLPKIYLLANEGEIEEARILLRSYYTTYIKEEIQAEAITRNVGAFQRFLNIAAQFNGNIIEYSNISSASSVSASTVKEYFSILEDTLLGRFLWPFAHSERKKKRAKFYFFDCGVINAIQNRLVDPLTPQETGFMFETLMHNQLIAIRDYFFKEHEFSFWQKGDCEVDFIVEKHGKPIMAIECKSGLGNFNYSSIRQFKKTFPKVPIVIASLHDEIARKTADEIEILPWKTVLDIYKDL